MLFRTAFHNNAVSSTKNLLHPFSVLTLSLADELIRLLALIIIIRYDGINEKGIRALFRIIDIRSKVHLDVRLNFVERHFDIRLSFEHQVEFCY